MFFGSSLFPWCIRFEIARRLSENRGVTRKWILRAQTYFPANSDSPAREKLLSLRVALLRLHKTLLNMERRDYEREYGYVNTGELFRLVIDHSQFAWLHNISEFVVRIDETLAAKEPITPEYTSGAISLARKMFRSHGIRGRFQKKYFDAIQRDPAVVIEHAELARLFTTSLSTPPPLSFSKFPDRLARSPGGSS